MQGAVNLFSMSPNALKAKEWAQGHGQPSGQGQGQIQGQRNNKNIVNVSWAAMRRSASGGTVPSAASPPANESARMPLALSLDPYASCGLGDNLTWPSNRHSKNVRNDSLQFAASSAAAADVYSLSSAHLRDWGSVSGMGSDLEGGCLLTTSAIGHEVGAAAAAALSAGADTSTNISSDGSMRGCAVQAVRAPVGPALAVTRLRCFYHFGQIMGLALRSRVPLPLALSPLAWKPLVGEARATEDFVSIDRNLTVAIDCFRHIGELGVTASNFEDLFDQMYVAQMSDGTEVELVPEGAQQRVSYVDRFAFTVMLLRARLRESELQLNAIRSGLYSIVPPHALPLFTWEELELLVCGRPAVDVALLREATTFGSGIGPNSPHIRRFWAALEGMSVEARRLFLRLVWWGAGSAGTTQTSRHRFAGAGGQGNGFPSRFRIVSPLPAMEQDPDRSLPHADLELFALAVPRYSSVEVARARLLQSINQGHGRNATRKI